MMSPSYTSYADEKLLARHQEHNVTFNHRVRPTLRSRIFGHFLPAFLLMSAVLLLFRSTFVTQGHYDASKDFDGEGLLKVSTGLLVGQKVQLEAHIMSKCPDARDCLQQLVVPVMAQVSDKVDFKLSYIGK